MDIQLLEVSEQIKQRLETSILPYSASDNISSCIHGDNLNELENEVTKKFEEVMKSLVIDLNDPNSKGTPRRLAKMFIHEVFRGRYYPKPDVTSFPNEGSKAYTGMLVIRVEIKSVCAHHWQPVNGICYIGIIPNGKVIGLSKYVRLAQWVARRGTLQEELTNQIAKVIMEAAKCNHVAVHIRAEHGCMTNRGVNAHSSLTQTTVLHGEFDAPEVRKEFFDAIDMQEK